MLHKAGIVFLILTLAPSVESAGGEPSMDVPAELVLERFPIAKGGDTVLVPLRLKNKEHLFMLDTGCTRTIFESSLPLSKPREVTTVETAGGEIELKIYDTPESFVGSIPLRVPSVMKADLERLRESSGYRIDGCLGMDFLGGQIVRIDFDKGELLFLKSLPVNSGEWIPIEWEPGEIPKVVATLADQKDLEFAIDTGAIGVGFSGALEVLEMRSRVRSNEFQEIGSVFSETASGRMQRQRYRGTELNVYGFSIEKPILDENPYRSSLDLGFWSRFTVTFDFPARRAYLRKGKDFDRQDGWNYSGLRVIRRSGLTIIEHVADGSPGAAAGFVAGDVLLTLGQLQASDSSVFELKAAIWRGGVLECVVRRRSRLHSLNLDCTAQRPEVPRNLP